MSTSMASSVPTFIKRTVSTPIQEEGEGEESPTPLSPSPSLSDVVLQEFRALSAFAALAAIIRIVMADVLVRAQSEDRGSVQNILSRIVVQMVPYKVSTGQAPGFLFASGWLLMLIQLSFGVYPNLPIRLCETVLGRLSWFDAILVLPVHFGSVFVVFYLFRVALRDPLAGTAVAPIVYADKNEHGWLEDFLRETVATAAFVVAMLVLPVLFRINRLPQWMAFVSLYPVYNIGVDARGMGSTLGPNILYALHTGSWRDLGQAKHRFAGSIVGALLGGVIMRTFFPDDDRRNE